MPTGTNTVLIAAKVVNRKIVWAAGGGFRNAVNDGRVVRTVDGGSTWRNVTPFNETLLVFRDVEVLDRDHALVLSIGDGPLSRIYRTADGGATWRVAFQNPDDVGFYDCIAFFDKRHGIAVGDAIGGRFLILLTDDAGRSWHRADTSGMPPAFDDEGVRATGTSLVTAGGRDAWFGTVLPRTANTPDARVFHTGDRGRTWEVANTPIAGATGGILSLAFRDRRHGVAIGGNPPDGGNEPDVPPFDFSVVATTSDGGRTWTRTEGAPAGFRNSVTWIPERKAIVVVGHTGSDISFDGGRTWRLFDDKLLLGVDCRRKAGCWAVGQDGLAAKLKLTEHQ